MRIDDRDLKNVPTLPERAARVRASGEAGRAFAFEGGSESDQIELDDRRRVIDEAMTADAAAREAKIQRLSQEVRGGTYQVDAQELSRAIVDGMVADGGMAPTGNL